MIDYDTPIYIAGPMTGLENLNYPAFHEMEQKLKNSGYKNILSPAHIADGDTSKSYEFYMREALKLVIQAGAMVFLDGWRNSKGAYLEYQVARRLNVPCFLPEEIFFGSSTVHAQCKLVHLDDELTTKCMTFNAKNHCMDSIYGGTFSSYERRIASFKNALDAYREQMNRIGMTDDIIVWYPRPEEHDMLNDLVKQSRSST